MGGRRPERRQGDGMPKKTHHPRLVSGAGRGIGLGACVMWGPVHPVMNSRYGMPSEKRLEKKMYFLSLTMIKVTWFLGDGAEGREFLLWKFQPIHRIAIQLKMFVL